MVDLAKSILELSLLSWSLIGVGILVLIYFLVSFLYMDTLTEKLRGILPVWFVVAFSTVIPPLLYALAYIYINSQKLKNANAHYAANTHVMTSSVIIFISLWALAAIILGIVVYNLFFGKPKDWLSYGIIFTSKKDYKNWKKDVSQFMLVPAFIALFTIGLFWKYKPDPTWRRNPRDPVFLLIELFGVLFLVILIGKLWEILFTD